MPSTRLETEFWLLGNVAAGLEEQWLLKFDQNVQSDLPLPFHGRPKLPTKGQALKLMLFLKKSNEFKSSSTAEVANKVLEEVLRYCKMANIPVLAHFRSKKWVIKIFDDYQKLLKHKNRKTDTEEQKRVDFVEDLEKLLDIAAEDAEEKINKDRLLENEAKSEDVIFLEDQRGPRIACIDVKNGDLDYSKSVKEKEDRIAAENKAKEKENSRIRESESIHPAEIQKETIEDNTDDDEFEPKVRKKSRTVTLEVLRNIFADPEVTTMLDRTKCTNRVTTGVVASVLKSAGANLNDFTLSKDTIKFQRNKKREVITKTVKIEFEAKKPLFACIHWDGKLIDNVMGTKDEKLAVLVSGAPHFIEGKVLGIPSLVDDENNPTSTGEAQFSACLDLIDEWNVKDNICAMCFDTTSSNTGAHRGACSRLQRDYFEEKVLWFGCRHHVSELIIRAVWYTLFDADNGPENKAYQQVKDIWPDLDTSASAPFKKLQLRSPLLLDLKTKAIDYYMKILSVKNRNDVLPRDDYRQLAETSLMLLGGIPPGGVTWKKPGAVHKARFMANSLYSNVMYAFQDVLGYDADDIAALRRFVVFNVLLYVPHFLSAGVGSDAPFNDLKLFKLISKFRIIDGELADTALNVLRRHLWYLTEEVVVFSLFSNKLSSDEKSRIAAKLLTFPVPDHIESGKPEFPDLLERTQFADLIGPKSWFLFLKLKVGYGWLSKSRTVER